MSKKGLRALGALWIAALIASACVVAPDGPEVGERAQTAAPPMPAACPSSEGSCSGDVTIKANLLAGVAAVDANGNKGCACYLAVTNTRVCKSSCPEFKPSAREDYECKREDLLPGYTNPCRDAQVSCPMAKFVPTDAATNDFCDNIQCPVMLAGLEQTPAALRCNPPCPGCDATNGWSHTCSYVEIPQRLQIVGPDGSIIEFEVEKPDAEPGPDASPTPDAGPSPDAAPAPAIPDRKDSRRSASSGWRRQ